MDYIPLRLSGIVRFRPRAKFNPYVGAGIGYSIVGFDPSDEFNQLSLAIDSSQGGQGQVTSALDGSPSSSGRRPQRRRR